MAENSRDSESHGGERRTFLRGAEHKTGLAYGNGTQSILIPLGHFALILVALFIVSNEADKAGEAKARSDNAYTLAQEAKAEARDAKKEAESGRAYALAQEAKMEARVLQDKVEDLRLEIAKGKGKP